MITKLLFTVAVIFMAYLVLRNRNRRTRLVQTRGQGPSGGRSPSRNEAPAPVLPRYLAYGFLALMLAGSGLFLVLQWRDDFRVVTVRVINTNTGNSVSFQARRGDVEERSFETLDGRRVVLAAVERLEMGGE